jgi:hypothetical protein
VKDIIRTAIETRAVLRIIYKRGERLVEPYCHGISTAGNEVIRAYQLSGASESGKSEGWKMLKVSGISHAEILPRKFVIVRNEYNPNDKGMRRIISRI